MYSNRDPHIIIDCYGMADQSLQDGKMNEMPIASDYLQYCSHDQRSIHYSEPMSDFLNTATKPFQPFAAAFRKILCEGAQSIRLEEPAPGRVPPDRLAVLKAVKCWRNMPVLVSSPASRLALIVVEIF